MRRRDFLRLVGGASVLSLFPAGCVITGKGRGMKIEKLAIPPLNSRLHVCLICHTEGDANSFEVGVPAMLRIREEVEQKTGKKCVLTWALGTFHGRPFAATQKAVFDEYREIFLELAARGDEIGLHPHGIVENGRWTVDPFIVEDTRRLTNAGFPAPMTFVAGGWAFYPSTLAIIEKQGYRVDASVVAGPTRQRKVDDEGNVIYDYPPSEAIADVDPFAVPYRLSRDSVVRRGNSTVIEVPVTGHLMDLSPGGNGEAVKRYTPRRERLAGAGVDIHEIFWHPWELLQGYNSWSEEPHIQQALMEFLIKVGTDPDVRISSVYEAAMDWAQNAKNRTAETDANDA